MTSPVDFISGEHGVDALALHGAEAVEGQHRLLHRDGRVLGQVRAVARRGQHPGRTEVGDRLPTAIRAAALASCTAVALDTNGTVRLARGLASIT